MIARSERFLWGSIGLIVGSAVIVQTQRHLWKSAAEIASALPNPPPKIAGSGEEDNKNLVFGSHAKARAKNVWNDSIDCAFKPIVTYFSKKGL